MIVTFTSNLAIDLFIETDHYLKNAVNRTNYSHYTPNGKGVNVSQILKHYQVPTVATGFKAGFTGDYIERALEEKGIATFFPEVPGKTRINIFTRVLSEDAEYTLVNDGPAVTEAAKQSYITYLFEQLKPGDILTINGSFSENIDLEYLQKVCEVVAERKAQFVVDHSSALVLELLASQPLLLKPNEEELCGWFGEKPESIEQFIRLGKKVLTLGAQALIISLGEAGALYLDPSQVLRVNAPRGQVVNTACSGDALLGAFLALRVRGESVKGALREAVAVGSSTAFTEGLTDFSNIGQLKDEIMIEEVEV